MPEDLQEDYADFAVRSGNPKEDGWRAYARGLIERSAELEQQLAAKWISVEERLPEPIGTKEEIQAVRGYSFTASVLVCEKQTRDVIVATLWRSPSGPVHWEVQGGYYSENCSGDCTPRIALEDVTDWQPLPAAPVLPDKEPK